MARHGPGCTCNACAARRISDIGERATHGQTRSEWRRQQGGGRSSADQGRGPNANIGACGDCGGTKDCIHCNSGTYPRRDGTLAVCGRCHGRTRCHACRGTGYGGQKCKTPTYFETVERNKQAGWQSGGSVDGRPARTRQQGSRIEALWGGENPRGDGADHGHLASSDGVNADYVAYPGGEVVVDNNRQDPYKTYKRKRRL